MSGIGKHNSEDIRFYDIQVPENIPDFPEIAEKRAAAHRRVDEEYDNWMVAAWVNNEIGRVQEEAGEFVSWEEAKAAEQKADG